MVGRVSIESVLRRIDRRGYKAYKDLAGASEDLGRMEVRVSRVQGDPFAPPSVIEVHVKRVKPPAGAHPVPYADYAHRLLSGILPRYSMRGVGEGGSGRLSVPTPSPIVIPRSAVEARPRNGEFWSLLFRVWAGLPSRGRRVLAGAARELLLDRLPRAVERVLEDLAGGDVERHISVWKDQEYIRSRLDDMGLYAFVGDGSILPRKCGGCWEPLEDAVPFESPPSMRVEIELPSGRVISGMGLPRGVTTITGPAFHGKTTLAEAIAHGVWNHIPGDGRELVVSDHMLAYVESENGRWVSCVDASPFIEALPGGADTRCFTTPDASGATSIAASIQEYVEAGASGVLFDEDQTATNIIHRDVWAEEITGKRTVNPLSDMAPSMKKAGLSMIAVASGAMPLLESSDRIVVMDEFRSRDATEKRLEASRVLREMGYRRVAKEYGRPAGRVVAEARVLEKPRVKGFVAEARNLKDRIDLRPLRQVEEEQQLSTAWRAASVIASRRGASIAGLAREISSRLWRWDYSMLTSKPGPEISYVRPLEIAFMVNRIPGLRACYGRYCG
ncbi:ABC-ATPase domain-containing protein [Aeropyrum camini]|uniref:Predicted ATPase of the ABC class n=1 Tax=Aeropyrum camini SY1 = JCM 12091 TaxID=1198449 RepID=U3TF58_9CREN|nr:ABC-ATPase domain-containing protein [Aeropyrum camini]BAN90603.1 predicted ATPase of the ABC class [Aeropyrum camini SY1 = JCM 12091]